MNEKLKIAAERAVFITSIVMVTASLIALNSILKNDSGYGAGLNKPEIGTLDSPSTVAETIAEPEFSYQRYSMTFAGDVNAGSMLGSSSFGTLNSLYTEEGGEYFLSDITRITKRDNMTVAFLSSVFSDSENLVPIEKSEVKEKEWYRAPKKNADILSLGGIDAVSLECSGTKDYGMDGYSDTKDAVEEAGCVWGDSGRAIYRTADSGVKIALYPCAYLQENVTGIISWIENAAESNDFVVVCVSVGENAGDENEASKANTFRSFIDAGANLVVGTNYAKIEAVEEYNGGFIAYSLGTLIDGKDKYSEKYSALLGVELIINEGNIERVNYTLTPLKSYSEGGYWHPTVISPEDDAEEYAKVLSMLEKQ